MVITKQLKDIRFRVLSPEEIKKISVVKIVTAELYDMDGYPVDGGLMDLRLGTVGPGVRCRTCGGNMHECLGHFGNIELARPIVHISFLSLIELALKSTCDSCNRILLKEEDIKIRNIKKAKAAKKCPYCGEKQPKIKVERPFYIYKNKQRISPIEIRDRLTKISNEDYKVLGVNPDACRPEWTILTVMLVPPVTVRPSITLETGERSEDDLTHKLSDIIKANQRLWENLNAGSPEIVIEDMWDLLQYHITTYFDNTISQIPPARHRSGQPLKTIAERIKGKEGHIRYNLAGKRVDFSSRSVISPDPYIGLNDVGIPYEIAKVLTVPERVTTYNKERLKEFIRRDSYPMANSIMRPDKKRKRVREELKEQFLEELDIGYVVERNIQDNDIVLFNRHPSLHRMSLMGHYAKIMPGKTFRIHPATTFPYNADFDGDEMNVHVPQTEEARAEAKILMDVKNHLISPKINTNVLGCVDDAITGLYLLTKREKIDAQTATQLLFSCGLEASKLVNINKEMSGKEVFSLLLPEKPEKVNFEARTKTGDVFRIKDSKIVAGAVDEAIVGIETEKFINYLDLNYGRDETLKFMKRIFLLGVLYLTREGFTVGLSDFKMHARMKEESQNILNDAEKKVEQTIDKYRKKELEIIPGRTLEETRETKILQTLNEVRAKIGDAAKQEFVEDNPAHIMMRSGAGGNLLYLTQMALSVGQQAFGAKRMNFGYKNRTLSFYREHDLSPRSGGLIVSSYISGLKSDEFFFTSITGRDGLMDTALRTPKSGYLYRRLMNALQDMRVEYDNTVRDSNANIIQFEYGEDGIDITKEHLKENKIMPAEAVGVVAAESFGEPSTQMTLNVFHFAGVSEMQVTVGLPRLLEIFDAKKVPSTPQMEIFLDAEHNNEDSARRIAQKIREVRLQETAKTISIDFTNAKINIELDKEFLKEFNLKADKISEALKEKDKKLHIRASDTSITIKKQEEKVSDFKELYRLKEKLKKVIISGVEGIKQVLPVKRDANYIILTSGSNLKKMLTINGVDKDKTTTNNFYEIAELLGIEAARQAIMQEVERVIEKQGIAIDGRHITLIADAMTVSGTIKGVTRVGIISDKNSILARASFETPIKHFVEASTQGATDHLVSVIENLILNQPVPVGTGLPGLLVIITKHEELIKKLKQEAQHEKKAVKAVSKKAKQAKPHEE